MRKFVAYHYITIFLLVFILKIKTYKWLIIKAIKFSLFFFGGFWFCKWASQFSIRHFNRLGVMLYKADVTSSNLISLLLCGHVKKKFSIRHTLQSCRFLTTYVYTVALVVITRPIPNTNYLSITIIICEYFWNIYHCCILHVTLHTILFSM